MSSARVLLVGTFHFDDTGLNRYRPAHRIDVRSAARQREVEDVVDRLAAFRPTRVAVERRPDRQPELDAEYRAYQRGELALTAHEAHQLGFRLAGGLGLDRVHGIDAWGRYYEPALDLEEHAAGRGTRELRELVERELGFDPDAALEAYARRHGQRHEIGRWTPRYLERARRFDQGKMRETLRESLLRLNSEAAILDGHGAYLVDGFKVGVGREYPGADLATAWYSRNLRIFANLQRITRDDGERILVIFGAGHLAILRHCVQASPEYRLDEVRSYLA